MRHLLRAVGALSVAGVMIAATLSPAQAYYRAATDPRGDVEAWSGCAGVRHVTKLDLLRYGASATDSGGRWRLRIDAAVAKLTKPGRATEQELVINVYDRPDAYPVIIAAVSRERGSRWDGSMQAVDTSYPVTQVRGRSQGRTILLSGPILKPNKTYRVAVWSNVTKRRGDRPSCIFTDRDNRAITRLSTHERRTS